MMMVPRYVKGKIKNLKTDLSYQLDCIKDPFQYEFKISTKSSLKTEVTLDTCSPTIRLETQITDSKKNFTCQTFMPLDFEAQKGEGSLKTQAKDLKLPPCGYWPSSDESSESDSSENEYSDPNKEPFSLINQLKDSRFLEWYSGLPMFKKIFLWSFLFSGLIWRGVISLKTVVVGLIILETVQMHAPKKLQGFINGSTRPRQKKRPMKKKGKTKKKGPTISLPNKIQLPSLSILSVVKEALPWVALLLIVFIWFLFYYLTYMAATSWRHGSVPFWIVLGFSSFLAYLLWCYDLLLKLLKLFKQQRKSSLRLSFRYYILSLRKYLPIVGGLSLMLACFYLGFGKASFMGSASAPFLAKKQFLLAVKAKTRNHPLVLETTKTVLPIASPWSPGNYETIRFLDSLFSLLNLKTSQTPLNEFPKAFTSTFPFFGSPSGSSVQEVSKLLLTKAL